MKKLLALAAAVAVVGAEMLAEDVPSKPIEVNMHSGGAVINLTISASHIDAGDFCPIVLLADACIGALTQISTAYGGPHPGAW